MYKRLIFNLIRQRLSEPRRFIQVLSGPRQVGKTTLARQVLEETDGPNHYASADEPTIKNRVWIEQQWEVGRTLAKKGNQNSQALMVLDEIHKITGWSEVIKRLWDEDSYNRIPLQALLLGSSPLLMQRGLTESLAGRFEIVPITHWSFIEMHQAFDWDLEYYLYYGGYPGTATLIGDHPRWVTVYF